jgi:AcrR family transcriptional regulator
MTEEAATVSGNPHRRRGPRRTAVKRRTQAERSAETQRKLIEAAIAVLHQVGYGATTTGVIAHEAGVSRGAMLHQFPTKVDLMLAVVSDVYHRETSEYRERGRLAASPREQFFQFPDLMWDILTRPSAIAVLEIMIGSRSDKELAKRLGALQRQIETSSRETVEQILKDGGFSDLSEVNAVRRLFVAAVRGLSIDLMLLQDRRELDQAIRLLARLLRALFEGHVPADEPAR